MLTFSERFMEDCVSETPDVFLPDVGEMLARQFTVGGFRPDLLLRASDGRLCIVELQQRALDRVHLYKCLEYRDLLAEKEEEVPRVILLCETLDDRYRGAIRTHNVEVVEIKRAEFVRRALKHCPLTMEQHLTTGESADQSDHKRGRASYENPIALEPFDWHDHSYFIKVFDHVSRQFGRANLSRYDLPLPYQNEVYGDLYHFADGHPLQGQWPLSDIRHWNLEKLLNISKSDLSDLAQINPHDGRESKPRVAITAHRTSKGNLSVVWYPDEEFGIGDFRYWSDGRYGYQRPENELLFVRGINHLDSSVDRRARWRHPEWYSVIDELLICLLRATFNHLVSALRIHFKVRVATEFEFDTIEERCDDPIHGTRTRVVGWRLYSVEARQRAEEASWFDDFEKMYGIDPKKFFSIWLQEASKPRRSAGSAYRHVLTILQGQGSRMSATECRQAMERLQKPIHKWRIPDELAAILKQ